MTQYAGQITSGAGTAYGYVPCDGRWIDGERWLDYRRRIGGYHGRLGIRLRVPVSPGNQVRLYDDPNATTLPTNTPVAGNQAPQLRIYNPMRVYQAGVAAIVGHVWPPDQAVSATVFKDGAKVVTGAAATVAGTVVTYNCTYAAPASDAMQAMFHAAAGPAATTPLYRFLNSAS